MMITKKSLFIDANQNETPDGKAFGFIGTNATDEYTGWFFTWPSDRATIENRAELEQVIASLDPDELGDHEYNIQHRWAEEKLRKFLNSILRKNRYAESHGY